MPAPALEALCFVVAQTVIVQILTQHRDVECVTRGQHFFLEILRYLTQGIIEPTGIGAAPPNKGKWGKKIVSSNGM
jgi:hypothetical protein